MAKRRTEALAVPPGAASRAVLSSGRSVVLHAGAEGESLEVRSPDGETEVRIAFTPEGPVVSLRCARLELESAGAVAVSCRSFDLRTTEDVSVNGRNIFLNCDVPEGSL